MSHSFNASEWNWSESMAIILFLLSPVSVLRCIRCFLSRAITLSSGQHWGPEAGLSSNTVQTFIFTDIKALRPDPAQMILVTAMMTTVSLTQTQPLCDCNTPCCFHYCWWISVYILSFPNTASSSSDTSDTPDSFKREQDQNGLYEIMVKMTFKVLG